MYWRDPPTSPNTRPGADRLLAGGIVLWPSARVKRSRNLGVGGFVASTDGERFSTIAGFHPQIVTAAPPPRAGGTPKGPRRCRRIRRSRSWTVRCGRANRRVHGGTPLLGRSESTAAPGALGCSLMDSMLLCSMLHLLAVRPKDPEPLVRERRALNGPADRASASQTGSVTMASLRPEASISFVPRSRRSHSRTGWPR